MTPWRTRPFKCMVNTAVRTLKHREIAGDNEFNCGAVKKEKWDKTASLSALCFHLSFFHLSIIYLPLFFRTSSY